MGSCLCKPAIDGAESEHAIDNERTKPDSSSIETFPTNNAQLTKNKEFLSKVKLFQRLPAEQHDVLAGALTTHTHPKGYKLINQGDEGDSFYVIVAGSVIVSVDGKKVATLQSGDYLGENALLRDEPRNASITADTEITVLKMTRAQFQELKLAEKLEFKHRKAVAGQVGSVVTKPPTQKSDSEKRTMMKALKANKNLTDIVDLDESKCKQLIDVAWEETVEPGTSIIEQGSDQADYFYIVKKGTFDVFIKVADDKKKSGDDKGVQKVLSIEAGGSFGELALIFYAPRAATVKAKEKAVVWVVDRGSFKSVMVTAAQNKAKESAKFFAHNDFFLPLHQDERKEAAVAWSTTDFKEGEVIFEQGDKPSSFYVLIEGEIAEIKDGVERRRLKGSAVKGELFGEGALLSRSPRSVTAKVISEKAVAFSMDRASFEALLAPWDQIKKRGPSGESFVGRGGGGKNKVQEVAKVNKSMGIIKREDLTILGLLGCGGFGAVQLVQHKTTQDVYALKILSKGHVVKCRMQKSVMQEKNIQRMCDSNFIVKLYACYNEPQNLCFLLELAIGGELYDTYCKRGFHGSVKHAQYYAAATLFAFEHLHDKMIVFRDLKPENLLLDGKGFCKLTDMGLAKVVVGKTSTTCGTPDYFAPEVIAGIGHGVAVDWWTLGILIFEFVAGHAPFETASPAQTMKKIQAGIEKVNFPSKLKPHGQDLIHGLLRRQPNDRLPMKKGWTDNVKNHTWYEGFKWQPFFTNEVDPPYKPVVKNRTDTKNFAANPADKPPVIPYKDDGSGWDKDFAT